MEKDINFISKKEEKSELSQDEIRSLMARMGASLKVQNEIGFGDKPYKAPAIGFYMDKDQYFDPAAYEIHIGGPGIVDMFHPITEVDFLSALNYVRGHEEQHVKSTASVPYAWGVQRSREVVLEYLSRKLESPGRVFRNPADYDTFVQHILPERLSYPVSDAMLTEIVSSIQNSLEDGRIERIRAARYPGFRAMRTLYRGIFWTGSPVNTGLDYDTIKDDPRRVLIVITNSVLTLATCQKYQSGFVAAFGGTEIWDAVQSVKPDILAAVSASRTRDMARRSVSLTQKIAPYIADAIKLTGSEEALLEALKELVKTGLEVDPSASGRTESEEECSADGADNPPLSSSDLVSGNDKEMGGKTNHGHSIRPSKSGDNPKARASDRENGKAVPETTSDGLAKDGQRNGNETDGTANHGDSIKMPKTDSTPESCESDGHGNEDRETDTPDIASRDDVFGDGRDPETEAIKAAMNEAAEKCRENADEDLHDVNAGESHARDHGIKETADNSKPVTQKEVKGLTYGYAFAEIPRAYQLSEPLPPTIAARGRTMRRKNEKYFRSLNRPAVSYLNSGRLDPARMPGLAMGDVDVFIKDGQNRHFDGCAYILIDNSGSMCRGHKRMGACKSAAVIEEAFKGMFPIKITAFDIFDGTVSHELVKSWHEVNRMNCCWNFYLRGRTGYGNADACDIAVASHELMARPESKKLLVILSDGQPTRSSVRQTKDEIEKARKHGIKVCGIYFESGGIGPDADTFKEMYEKDYILSDTDGIDQSLTGIFQKFSRS